jgi:hypothetical protein
VDKVHAQPDNKGAIRRGSDRLGQSVKPFDIEVDSGNAYFLTYPPERREQRNIQLFEKWLVGRFRGEGEYEDVIL